MKQVVRILSGVLAVLSAISGICLLLAAIGWPISTECLQELAAEIRRMPTVLIVIAAALVLSAAGVIVLYGLFSERLHRRTSALLEKNAFGETAVSFASLAKIAEQTVKKRTDVSDCKTKVYAVGSSIRIDVRAVTSPTGSLTELTRSLQREISDSITQICGTAVGLVDVTVDQADTSRIKS